MTHKAHLKKTAAIRMARQSVPNPVLATASQFLVRVPAVEGHPDSEFIEIVTESYLDAQRTRAYAVARVALVLMGLEHLELRPEEGSTIEQLMDSALQRSLDQTPVTAEPTPFWQVPAADRTVI